MAEITIDQYYPSVVLDIKDAHGNKALVDGIPVWASSDETVLKVTPAEDGMSAKIEPVAPGGPARVTVTADADRGAGVKPLVGVTEDITVTTGEASVMTITLGEPVAKAA